MDTMEKKERKVLPEKKKKEKRNEFTKGHVK